MRDFYLGMALIECNCKDVAVKYANDFVCTTNIFHLEAMIKWHQQIDDTWFARERYTTMKGALQTTKGKDITFTKELLSDKYGFICQYDRKENRDTVWSSIYDVKTRQIYRVEGNPARKDFKIDTRFSF